MRKGQTRSFGRRLEPGQVTDDYRELAEFAMMMPVKTPSSNTVS